MRLKTNIRQIGIGCISILLALSGAICLAIVIAPIVYGYMIEWQGLTTVSGLSKSALMENFMVIISYLVNPLSKQLVQPYFSSSQDGLSHFVEVKFWIQVNALIFVMVSVWMSFILKKARKQKYQYVLKATINIGQLIPFVLIVISAVAFEPMFILFHQILFKNELWYFNPLTDPVILVLPQIFFFVMFVVIILVYEMLLWILRFLLKLPKS